MKQGSNVHKVLEEQVHTSIPVEVKTREDMFGLRLWNVIQGLRSLRVTGITRELAVWGVIEGQVINGIVDEINTRRPEDASVDKVETDTLESKQTTLETFLKTATRSSVGSSVGKSPTYYITDVKTRQSRSLPPVGSRLRPTHMQLMLYHKLISDLVSGTVPSQLIFDRYRLDSEATFSDVFIAEVSKLDEDLDLDDVEIGSSQDSVAELLEYNNLSRLWAHMISEYEKTIPTVRALAPSVSAEFRLAYNGAILGRRSFEVDRDLLDKYIADEMSWWKGKRPTKGVEIEEAFKCQICEFADDCSWRQEKVEEVTQKARAKRVAKKATDNG